MTNASFRDLLRRSGIKPAELARLFKVEKSTITRWSQTRVPAERVLQIEAATGISRHDIRPDIYGLNRGEAA